MQLNAARKRQSAIFESKTTRDSFMSDVIKKLEEPGNDDHNVSNYADHVMMIELTAVIMMIMIMMMRIGIIILYAFIAYCDKILKPQCSL
jgi:hypothetical protein